MANLYENGSGSDLWSKPNIPDLSGNGAAWRHQASAIMVHALRSCPACLTAGSLGLVLPIRHLGSLSLYYVNKIITWAHWTVEDWVWKSKEWDSCPYHCLQHLAQGLLPPSIGPRGVTGKAFISMWNCLIIPHLQFLISSLSTAFHLPLESIEDFLVLLLSLSLPLSHSGSLSASCVLQLTASSCIDKQNSSYFPYLIRALRDCGALNVMTK